MFVNIIKNSLPDDTKYCLIRQKSANAYTAAVVLCIPTQRWTTINSTIYFSSQLQTFENEKQRNKFFGSLAHCIHHELNLKK